jgi:hypothetical protein
MRFPCKRAANAMSRKQSSRKQSRKESGDMKMLAEYLENAIKFEQIAAEEKGRQAKSAI